jgi:tRNA A-37 threonylcarbamoyl transferase component Bud32
VSGPNESSAPQPIRERSKPEVPKLAALTQPAVPPPESVELVESVEPTAPCLECGAPLAAGMTFCTACGATLGPDPLIDKVIDERYQVIRRLGAGAMGAVYEVRHLRLGKHFAMKVIHRELTQIPEFVARFEREAHSTSRLQHPNCILVTDFGHAETGELYLVMELLEGRSLSDLLDKPVPVGTALETARQILLGVQHAHQAGVIHRDLKPENVFRVEKPDGSWQLKVVDFGIAKLPFGGDARDGREPLTKAGVVFGTPQYMAPEQALGGDVGERADLYAIGVILWRMLTGRPLFEVEGHVELLSAKLAEPAPPLDRVAPGVFSASLQELLRRTLERKPSERIASAEEALAAIDAILAEPGGGLAIAAEGRGHAGAGLIEQLRTFGSRLPESARGWYRCEGAGAPASWPLRLRGLVTTARGALVLGGALALLGLLLCLGLLLVPASSSPPPDLPVVAAGSSPGSGKGTSKGKGPVAVRPPTRKVVTPPSTPLLQHPLLERAGGLIAQGNCRDASLELKNLVQQHPTLARGHYLLGVALVCRRLHGEALAAYRRAIAVDPRYRSDARVLEDGERMLKLPRLRGEALAFLGNDVGAPAIPALLRIAGQGTPRALRHDAIALCTKLGASEQIDWVQSLGLDLREGGSCSERAETVAKLRKLRDPRAIPILRAARDERTGWFGRQLKHYCIRSQIIEALKELQELPPR